MSGRDWWDEFGESDPDSRNNATGKIVPTQDKRRRALVMLVVFGIVGGIVGAGVTFMFASPGEDEAPPVHIGWRTMTGETLNGASPSPGKEFRTAAICIENRSDAVLTTDPGAWVLVLDGIVYTHSRVSYDPTVSFGTNDVPRGTTAVFKVVYEVPDGVTPSSVSIRYVGPDRDFTFKTDLGLYERNFIGVGFTGKRVTEVGGMQAPEGREYLVVGISVRNDTQKTVTTSPGMWKIIQNGVTYMYSDVTMSHPDYVGHDVISNGKTTTFVVIYDVPAGLSYTEPLYADDSIQRFIVPG